MRKRTLYPKQARPRIWAEADRFVVTADGVIPIYSRGRKIKLNMAQARQIRRLNKQGTSRQDLARQFGVSVATVGRIVRNEAWRERS